MVKRFIGVTVLLAVITACEKGEPENPTITDAGRILFSTPMLSVESRSTFKNALSEGDEFGVLGYCVPYKVGTTVIDYPSGKNPWTLKKAQCPPDVFYNQKVVVGSNGCVYDRNGGTANDPKYWYRDGYDTNNTANEAITETAEYNYSFIAWYPYSGAFTIDRPTMPAEAGAPVLTFAMPQEGENIADPLDHKITPDAMVGVLYNQRKDGGSLRFNFSHVLTGLGFEVNNLSDYDLTIHSVSLSGSFYKDVTIDLTGDNVAFSFSDNRYTGNYALLSTDLSLPAPKEGETVNSSGLVGGEHLLLISGESGSFGENVRVNIAYTFNGQPDSQSIVRPSTFVPRPGVKYTAQLNFVGDTFVLQFVVDNGEQWEDGEADDGKDDNDDIVFE